MIFIIICVIVFLFFDKQGFGYSETSPLYTHFVYQFMHVNFMHLCMNLFSFQAFYKLLRGTLCLPALLFSYISSVLASFLSEDVYPTVGCSGLVYALIGVYVVLLLFSNKKTKVEKYKIVLSYSLIILFPLVIMHFIPYINSMCHVYSLVFGVISGVIIKIKSDEY